MATSHLRMCKDYSTSETYLFFGNSALRPVVIRNCNGASSVSFENAWVDRTRPSANVPVTGIPFAFLFKEATNFFLDMILDLGKEADEFRSDVCSLNDKRTTALACIKKFLTEDFGKHSV